MNANFVCGKPFTCTFAFIGGHLGWAKHVMGHTRGWMRCVSVCVFGCVWGKAGWGLTNEQITCSNQLACTLQWNENRLQLNLNSSWLQNVRTLLSLLSKVETINCAGLIFIESRHCLKETEDKLHLTANSSAVFTGMRQNTLSNQRTSISLWVQCFMLATWTKKGPLKSILYCNNTEQHSKQRVTKCLKKA